MNTLYYGDNLDIMRRYIKDETVDLVYLDPPFNSKQVYNVLFQEENGTDAGAQIKAFDDTWRWDHSAELAYQEVAELGGQPSIMMQSFRAFLGENDMMAYLSMMAPRLIELHRCLKESGSLYLHCDPTASHYLKILLDSIFGIQNFRNEIIWKRQSAHSDSKGYGSVHDTVLFYVKSGSFIWNLIYQPYEPEYVEQYYRYKDTDGRRFMSGDLGAAGLQGGGYEYEWKNVKRLWRVPVETMKRLDKEGRVFYTRNGIPRVKRYLDESKGMPVQDLWTDLESLRSWHAEKLGYPTQKPESLLERIITASSAVDSIILDPFCGCGTTINVAQKLNRKWIGIDITHLAIALMKHRLRDTFGDKIEYKVIGEPVDLAGAQALAETDKYQFQWWALGLVKARPIEEKKGADKGIDGRLFFHDDNSGKTKQVIFSVKAGHIQVSQVRDLRGVIEREKVAIGVFITMDAPTKPMTAEAAAAGFYVSEAMKTKHPKIQILTIEELLNGKKIDMPYHAPVTFKKAEKFTKDDSQKLNLFDQ
jgi:DNA modification methylase